MREEGRDQIDHCEITVGRNVSDALLKTDYVAVEVNPGLKHNEARKLVVQILEEPEFLKHL